MCHGGDVFHVDVFGVNVFDVRYNLYVCVTIWSPRTQSRDAMVGQVHVGVIKN